MNSTSKIANKPSFNGIFSAHRSAILLAVALAAVAALLLLLLPGPTQTQATPGIAVTPLKLTPVEGTTIMPTSGNPDKVTVEANNPPEFATGNAARSVPERVVAGDSDPEGAEVPVTDVNEVLTAEDDAATTKEDTAVDIDVASNDIAPDGGTLTFTLMTTPSHGTAAFKQDAKGVITYTPKANYNGMDRFEYIATGDGNSYDEATVTVTVTPVNDAPVVTGDATVRYAENGTVAVSTYTATDPDDDAITGGLTLSGADAGKFNISSAGALNFTNPPDFENPKDAGENNVYDVTVSASDGTLSGTLAVDITVTDVNEGLVVTGDATVPVTDVNEVLTAEDDDATTKEDTAVDIDVASNDTGPDGGTLTFTLRTTPSHGTAAFKQDAKGVITYTPMTNYNGIDTFKYIATGDENGYDEATVTVTVTPVNDAPVVTGDATVRYAENGAAAVGTYTATDPDDDVITGGLTLSGADAGKFNISSAGALNFTNPPDFENPADAGRDNVYNVTVSASDGSLSGTLAVTITVTDVNDVLTAEDDDATTKEDTAVDIDVASNDTGPDGATLTFTLRTTPSHGTAAFKPDAKGVITYTPMTNYNGIDTFKYIATGDENGYDEATVTVTVTPVNDEPVVTGDATVRYAENGAAAVATYTATDPDDDTITGGLTLSGADAGKFNFSSGALTFQTSPDFENPADAGGDNVYNVIVSASDGSLSGTLAVTITVTDVNEVLTVTGDATVEYAENGTAAIATYTATDPEGATVTWSLTGDDAEDFRVSSAGVLTFQTAPDFENPKDKNTDNVYNVTVSASDGTLSGTLAVQVTVTNVNEGPVVTGDATIRYAENGTAAVATYTAADPDSNSVTWTLTGDDAEDFSINTDGALNFLHRPDFENPTDAGGDNVYNVIVSASDGTLSGTLAVTITVTDVNDVLTAEDDAATTKEDTSVDIDVASNDIAPEGATLTFTLRTTPIHGTAAFKPGTTGIITYTPMTNYNGIDTFEYIATGDENGYDEATVTVTVTAVNDEPVVTGDATVRYAENGTAAVATYTATDPDSNSVTWTLTGDDAEDFSINTGGVLTFQTSPDFENPADAGGDNVYNVIVSASDGTLSGTLAVTITVTDVIEGPVITGDATISYAENGTAAVATYSVTDPEGATVTWSLTGDDAEDFSVNTDGVLTFQMAPDFENPADAGENNVYNVTVTATDSGGLSDSITVTITVTNVNEAPTVSGSTAVRYAENGTAAVAAYTAADPEGATVTWSLTGDDAEDFSVSSSGALTFQMAPDFETPKDKNTDNVYNVIVSASDGRLSGTLAVQVTVTDVNEVLTAADDAVTTKEDTAVDINVASNDTAPGGATLTFTLRTTPSHGTAAFKPDATGVITYMPKANYNGRDTFEYIATGDENSYDEATVTVTVTPVNDAPVVTGDATISYAENGTVAVGTYTATDPDDDTIAGGLTLSGADADRFHISTGGALNFTNPPDFENPKDKNTDNVYNIVVSASDGNLSGTLAVQVTVTNVNEGPVVTGDATVRYAENGTAAVGTYTATDPDGDTIAGGLTLSGADADQFHISTGGALNFTNPPDFENPTDVGRNNVYNVTVTATDSGGLSDSVIVTITVVDVTELPSAPATPSVAALTTTSLRVIWTAPANTGPTITSYDVQYRLSTSTAWTNTPMNVAATSTDITTGLTPNTAYHVRVRAINAEGDGNWSPHANVMTLAAAPTNNAPSFTETGPVDRNVAENAVPGAIVGEVVAANDPDVGDALTYSVLGSNDFTIDNTGQIKVASGASLDHEATSSYVVTVRVRDSKNPFGTADTAVDATITVNITVTDVDEPPTAATSGPTVMPMSRTGLTVTWTALSSAGAGCPPITGYDARYRLSTSTMWTDGPQNLNGTSTTLTGLTPNTAYQVQVRAKNHEGDGPWSVAGTGTTKANNAPVFNEGTTHPHSGGEHGAEHQRGRAGGGDGC